MRTELNLLYNEQYVYIDPKLLPIILLLVCILFYLKNSVFFLFVWFMHKLNIYVFNILEITKYNVQRYFSNQL